MKKSYKEISNERADIIRRFHDYLNTMTIGELCSIKRAEASDDIAVLLRQSESMTDLIDRLHGANLSLEVVSTIGRYLQKLAFTD